MRTRFVTGMVDATYSEDDVTAAFPGRYIAPWDEGPVEAGGGLTQPQADALNYPLTSTTDALGVTLKDFIRMMRVDTWVVEASLTVTDRFGGQETKGFEYYLRSTHLALGDAHLARFRGFTGSQIIDVGGGITWSSGASLMTPIQILPNERRKGGHLFSRIGGRNRFTPFFRFRADISIESGFGNSSRSIEAASGGWHIPFGGDLRYSGRLNFTTPKGRGFRADLVTSNFDLGGPWTFEAYGSATVKPLNYLEYRSVTTVGGAPIINSRFDSNSGEQLATWDGSTEPTDDTDGLVIFPPHFCPIVDGNDRNFVL